MSLYEGMFLIDNDLVREDWSSAKAVVTDALEKHGATIHTARRWDERALAYPIKGRRRATFLLTFFELDGQNHPELRRDLEINDNVLRYLITSAPELPETESEAAQAEGADDFTVPAPPADDAGSYRPIQTEDEQDGEEEGEGGEAAKAEGDAPAEAKADAKAEASESAEAGATTTTEAAEGGEKAAEGGEKAAEGGEEKTQ